MRLFHVSWILMIIRAPKFLLLYILLISCLFVIPSHYAEALPPGSPDSLTQTDQLFPQVTYSDGGLKIIRDEVEIELSRGNLLLPGDRLETAPKQFALIQFPPGGLLTVFPSSTMVLGPDLDTIRLKNAEIYYEMDSTGTIFPDILECYDARMSPLRLSNQTVSFALHCRGESGITLSTMQGKVLWLSHNRQYVVNYEEALVGRATSANFTRVHQPLKPEIIDSINYESDPEIETTMHPHFHWKGVPEADQYLIHIYRNDPESPFHQFTYLHSNEYIADNLLSGTYYFQVMAIDYYGVAGIWSEPVLFEISP